MTPVVLLHAFPLDHRMWDQQVARLRSAGHVVKAPDLGGFGASPTPGAPSLLGMIEPVLERLREPAVFVGLSMGGYLTMEVLRRAPEKAAGIVLVDTKASPDSPQARRDRFELAQRMDRAEDTADLPEQMLPNLLGRTTRTSRPEVVAEVQGWIEQAAPSAVANAARTMADRLDSLPILRRFEGPAAVVWGAEDTISPAADQQRMLEAMPQAVAREIPGVGHLSAVEDPAALNDVLLDILKDWL